MFAPYLRLPAAVKLLCLGILINRAGTMIVPFMALYLHKTLGLSEQLATLPLGAYGLGSILGSILGGHLADTVGRRPVMLFALFGGAAILLLLATLTTIWSVTACVFVFALVAEMYRPAGSAMIADLTPPSERHYAYSLTYISINLGFAIGPAIGGMLAERSFTLLFIIDAATTCTFALMVLLLVRETLPGHAGARGPVPSGTVGQPAPAIAAPRVPLTTALVRIARDRVFLVLALATLALSMTYSQAMSSFPLYLGELGITQKWYGRLISLNGLMIVLLQLPLAAWLSRFHRGRVVALASVVTAIGFGLKGGVSLIPTAGLEPLLVFIPAFGATIIIWTLGEMMHAVFLMTIVSDLAPPELRARYMGLISVCHGLGMALGMPLGGAVLGLFGGQVLWAGCTLFGLAAAALYLAISRQMAARPTAADG